MPWLADLAKEQRAIVDVATRLAQKHGTTPYLVGGPVRDLALGRPGKDIDLALEARAEALARDLASHFDATLRSFPQFLTYKVVADELPEIDVATTRAEEYPFPGSLPAVTPSTLLHDLERRDFSINAMALDLTNGTRIDPLGGMDDLNRCAVRVLHDRSFIDDPTRILRALRFAARLGFEIEPTTHSLLRAAIREGALDTVSRERLWREIFLAVEEDHAAPVLLVFANEGILSRFIGARVEIDVERLEALERMAERIEELDRLVIFLAALLGNTAAPLEALRGATLSLRRKKHAIEIAERAPSVRRMMTRAESEMDRLAVARVASDELLLYAAADLPHFTGWFDRLLEFRRLQLPFSGADLGVPPGPHVGVALDRTREAIFLREVAAGEALAFARATAMKYLEEQLNET